MSFGLTIRTLPDSYKRLLAPEDRKALGKDGLLSEEIVARGKVTLERDLRRHVLNILRIKGIVPISARDDKRSTIGVGLPDIMFSVRTWIVMPGTEPETIETLETFACAWELKLPGEKLAPEQIKMAARLSERPNSWRWALITSIDDALAELRAIGVK